MTKMPPVGCLYLYAHALKSGCQLVVIVTAVRLWRGLWS